MDAHRRGDAGCGPNTRRTTTRAKPPDRTLVSSVTAMSPIGPAVMMETAVADIETRGISVRSDRAAVPGMPAFQTGRQRRGPSYDH